MSRNLNNNPRNPNNRRLGSSYVMSLLSAIISTIVGFCISIPFFWNMMFGPEHEPYMSLWRVFAVLLVVIGLPMFIFGLIGIIAKRGEGVSNLESDVSRIRFATETQMINDLLNRKK